jgi:predicted secreted protein
MAITSALVLLSVIWFMTLFVVLPLRLTTQGDSGSIVPGTPAGSPEGLNLRRKLWVTTLVALVLWAIIAGVIVSGLISVSDIDWFNRMSDASVTPAGDRGE